MSPRRDMGPFQCVGFSALLLCTVVNSKVILEGLQRYGPMPIYLPVSYRILNAESAFFLQEANQDLMRNSSLQARTESFFIHQARQMPFVNASYGPLSVQQPVPLEMLQTLPGPFNTPSFTSSSVPTSASASPLFTFNWKVHTYIISERIHPSWPKVQVLFYIAGRDWDDYSAIHKLPCVRMFAFHETQEVRGTCRLKGELGICVAELEPLASWFSPPTVRPGRQRVSEQAQGTPVELYYMVQTTDSGDCSSEDSRKGSSVRTDQQKPMGYFAGHTPMQRIGSVRLFQPLSELKLDNNFVVMVPSKPIRQRETVSTFLALSTLSSVQIFTLRVKLKDGVAFLGASASNPVVWTVSQDFRSEGHRVVTLHCRRKENNFSQRVEAAGYQRILQVDLEVNGLMVTLGGREVTWQVEYPLTRTLTSEVQTLIRLAPQDLGGIVPLAMDTEILNTAVLTGRTVAVPVKVVTVGTDGAVSDVTESVECKSTDEQVIKVSERCDYVYVNGKETRGKSRVMLNFTYSFLSTQLEMSVWMPHLPLLIDVADPELSQIKGWRVPVTTGNRRYERVTDDKGSDDAAEERTENACVAQYQSTSLRVLTHFVADNGEVRGAVEEDRLGQQNFLLGSDWQVEVTQLVKDSLRVEDPKVAQLLEGQILVGLSAGTTKLQVLSPLTSLVLAERSIRVVDDKVSVTELGVQLVSGLSLSLQLSPGSTRAIVATATTQEVIESLKQESLISAWLQFSDGSMTPLDNYNPAHFTLSATSLDEQVVAVQRSAAWKWPIIVSKGEGQGLLVRVEMSPSEVCQKGKRHTVLATGMANIQVRFGQPEEQYRQPGDRRTRPDPPYYGGSISDMETGLINRGATTIRGHVPVRPNGGRLSADSGARVPSEFSEYPDQAELPRSRSTDEDLLPSRRGLTDLEIGMYALLGVFCLAILVFLINCISYAYKYRSKHLSLEAPEAMPHAHDWVWLGQEEGLCLQQQQQDELGGTLEEGSQLLNGGIQRGSTGVGGCSSTGRDHRNESLNSPTTKRKRVKFTTFSNVKSSNGCPVLSPLALVQTSEIKWVCPDIELGDSKDLRNYMEKLNENAIKNIA
ncbi:transmembrane protein 132C-like [Thunnus maccoyii]|uniref:transmembrane protein 132C-like n=1 Tax=Thunnus maccoyii TaxID=8240 RepID=UPI001C4D6A2D|nr:transmembrane protein 132C-like [Thunnus maccoyii]XP_042251012.1 transmembrane protein 132C-like [Thunnus maccoyii]XP_042251013.1 transmembrane protein 132C-like [Thunnus maccoyii]